MGLKVGMVKELLLVIILLIIVFRVIADTATDVGDAADNLTSTTYSDGANTYPLTSFFKKKGVILLAFIAGIVIAIITAVLALGGKK